MSGVIHPSRLPVDAPDAPAPAAHVERRGQARSLSLKLVVVRWPQQANARQETARIWNLSTRGIGLWLAHPIAAGTIVRLRFQHRRVTDRSGQVLNASAEGQAWVVHCLFDRPLSPAESRMLLT